MQGVKVLGLMSYYDALRYIPVSYSRETGKQGRFVIGVAPIDYSVFAMINDPMAPPEIRSSDAPASFGAEKNQLFHSCRVEEWACWPAGLTDVPCHLRQENSSQKTRCQRPVRSRSLGRVCERFLRTDDDVLGNGTQLDFSRTIEHETTREIGHVRGDPRRIQPVGLTKKSNTGAIEYWPMADRIDVDGARPSSYDETGVDEPRF